jgi:hypothetical protein
MSDINVNVTDQIVEVDVTDQIVEVSVENAAGPQGPAGPGVPVGGTVGQILIKESSTDYDTGWSSTNADLGEFGLKAGYLQVDTTPTNTPADQGTMYWDDSRETVALIMDGTIQHIGQDTFFYVKNSSGSSIPKGTSVRFDGTDGASGHIKIVPFLANGTFPSTYFLGVTAEAIGNGQFGQVMHFGELEGINTSGYTAGDLLYASTTVAGGFQTTAPVAPNNIVLVAAAVNSKNNGAIVVRPVAGSNINNDEGVRITSPTNGQVLKYNSTSGLWENGTDASSNIYNSDGTLTGNRTVTMGSNTLSFEKDLLIHGLTVGRGLGDNVNNTVLGNGALASNTTGQQNIAIGRVALSSNTSGINNTAIGWSAMQFNIGGSYNTSVGYNTLSSNTSGGGNTAIGDSSLDNNTTGDNNSALGYLSLPNNTTGGNNTAIGHLSLYNNDSGYFNTAIGVDALRSNVDSSYNTAVGSSALYTNNGQGNTAIGYDALYTNGTGVENTAVGYRAMQYNETGYENASIGKQSLANNVSGFRNIAVGYLAGALAGNNANATSRNSVYLGYNTKASASGNTNEIVVGASAVGLGSNTTVIGNSSTTASKLFGALTVGTVNAATTDTDKFLVSDSGEIKFRTGAELLSDIGGQAALTNPVTGTGVSGQVSYWSGTGTQAGSNNLFWDNANGRLGIGTNAPEFKLDVIGTARVSGTVANALTVERTTTSTNIYIRYQNATTSWYAGQTDQGTFGIGTNVALGADTKFNLTTGGNLLLGTVTDSGQRLQVQGTSLLNGSTTFGTLGAGTGMFWDNTNNRLGIGTSTPITALEVSGLNNGGGFQGLRIRNTGTSASTTTLLVFTTNTAAGNAASSTFQSIAEDTIGNVSFAFFTATNGTGTEKLRITSRGSVLVGTSSEQQSKMIVSGSQTASSAIARGTLINTSLSAAANNDVLVGLDVAPTFTNGAFTGVKNLAIRATGKMQLLDAGNSVYIGSVTNGQSDDLTNNRNIGIGFSSLTSVTTGANNIGIGETTNGATSGSFNIAIGSALRNVASGVSNIAIGHLSLLNLANASSNVALGITTLSALTSGSSNTAIGTNAGRYAVSGTTSLTSVDNSIFIGTLTRAANATNDTNEIVIGYDVVGLGSNTVHIGNDSTITSAIRGRLLLGTTTDSGLYQLDVNGTARVQDDLTVSKNQNGRTTLLVSNTTTGTNAAPIIRASTGTNAHIELGKFTSSTTAYKTIASSDAYIFNASASGDLSILNDFATGKIKFAAGGSSTVQWQIDANGNLEAADAENIILGTTTGTKIGTATSQKLSLWNATPDVQPTTAITAAAFVANTSGIVDDTATFGGYTLGQIVAALKRIGALA